MKISTIINGVLVSEVNEKLLTIKKIRRKKKQRSYPYAGAAEEMNVEDYQRVGH